MPEGYNRVSPYLVTADPAGVLRFFEKAFDGEPLRRHEGGGRIVHAEIRVGDSVIMLGDSGDGSTTPCHIHVYVPDVDAAYRRALEAGGKSVAAPAKKGDADKRGGVTDPTGTVTVWMGTQVE